MAGKTIDYKIIVTAKQAEEALKRLTKELEALKKKQATLTTGSADWNKMAGQIGTVEKQINKVTVAMDKLGKSTEKTGNMFVNITRYFTSFLLVQKVTAAVSDATQAFLQFENTLATNRALMGDVSGTAMPKLREQALLLGRTSKFSANEVADLQANLIKLGVETPEKINTLTEAIVNLAAATDEDLAKSGDVLKSILNQYGLDINSAKKVTDIMTTTFLQSASDLESYANSMKYVGNSAVNMGLNVAETSALLAQLSQIGIKGTSAGNTLNNVLIEMAKTSSKLTKTIGFQVEGFNGPKGMIAAFQKIKDLGLSVGDVFDTVNIRSARGILAFGDQAQIDNLVRMNEELTDIKLTAAEIAELQMNSITGDLKKLGNNIETVALQIGGVLNKNLREFIGLLSGLVDGIRSVGKWLVEHDAILTTIGKSLKYLTLWYVGVGLKTLIFSNAIKGSITWIIAQTIAIKNATVALMNYNTMGNGIASVTAGFNKLKGAIAGNWMSIAVIAGAALVEVYKRVNKETETLIEHQKEMKKGLEDILAITKTTTDFELYAKTSLNPEETQQFYKDLVDDISSLDSQIKRATMSLKTYDEEAKGENSIFNEDYIVSITKGWKDMASATERQSEIIDKLPKGDERSFLTALNWANEPNSPGKQTAMTGGANLLGFGELTEEWKKGEALLAERIKRQSLKRWTESKQEAKRREEELLKQLIIDAKKRNIVLNGSGNNSSGDPKDNPQLIALWEEAKIAEARRQAQKDEIDLIDKAYVTKRAALDFEIQLVLEKENLYATDLKNQSDYNVAREQLETDRTNNLKKRNELQQKKEETLIIQETNKRQVELKNIKTDLENWSESLGVLAAENIEGSMYILNEELKLSLQEALNSIDSNAVKQLEDAQKNESELRKMYEDSRQDMLKDELNVLNTILRSTTKTAEEKAITTEQYAVKTAGINVYYNGLTIKGKEELASTEIKINKTKNDAIDIANRLSLARQKENLLKQKIYMDDLIVQYEQRMSALGVSNKPGIKSSIRANKASEIAEVGVKGDKNGKGKILGEVDKRLMEEVKQVGMAKALELDLFDKAEQEKTEISKKYAKERAAIYLEESQKAIQAFSDQVGQVGEIWAIQKDMEQERIQSDYDVLLKVIDKNHEELLTKYGLKNIKEENMTASKKRKLERIEAKYAADKLKADEDLAAKNLALEKKYADKEFSIKVAQIAASTALGIMEIWSKWSSLPIVAAAMTAITAGLGAVQIAAAKQQRDNVKKLEFGGQVNGPSHKQGGVNVELEGGEVVINKKAASLPWVRDLGLALNSINNPKTKTNQNMMEFGGQVRTTSSKSNNSLSREDVQLIVQEVVSGVAAIPVVNNTIEMEKVQNKLSRNITNTTW